MFERLTDQFKNCPPERLRALADVWTRELELILERMFEICSERTPLRPPERARHEAVFELAQLCLWLEDRIIATKTSTISIERLDPHKEALAIESQTSRERIENTARNCAERIWMPLQEEWWKRFPLLKESSKATRGRVVALGVRSGGVRLQHFSPVFSNKLWADSRNQVRVYSLAIDQRIAAKDVGYRTWAREPFLYSQELERLFGLVEGDAKNPYMKLLQVQPFSEDDRRHWVAFLATQMFRTPWFIARNLAGLKEIVDTRSIRHPTDIGSLRRAYETLFTNDDIFGFAYRLVVGRKWELWKSTAGSQFVRADHPVLVSTWKDGRARVLYPLSPDRCFVAGPDPAPRQLQLVPDGRLLDAREVREVNRNMASTAKRTVMARPERNDAELKTSLEPMLGRRWLEIAKTSVLPEPWGDLL